jgi:hypothetical protein
VELVVEALEGERLLEGGELLALDVLDEGELEEPLVGHVAHRDRHGEKAELLRRPPPPLPRDDLVALAPPAHEDGLDDAALADGGGELLEPPGLHRGPRLQGIRLEPSRLHLRGGGLRRERRALRLREERGESLAEGLAPVAVHRAKSASCPWDMISWASSR